MFTHYLQLMITLRNVTMCLLFGLTTFFMESSLALATNMSYVITQIGTIDSSCNSKYFRVLKCYVSSSLVPFKKIHKC
jgi:hypothetical protein